MTREDRTEGYQKLLDSHMHVQSVGSDEEFYALAGKWQPDVIVHDCLNTEREYILQLKQLAKRVVTLEAVSYTHLGSSKTGYHGYCGCRISGSGRNLRTF